MLKRQNKQRLAYMVLLLGAIIFLASIKSTLLISKSDSLPQKFYLLVKGQAWQKYDLVAIKGVATKYTKDQHFTKRVLGVPGDLITVRDGQVMINGNIIATLKAATKDHKILTPIKAQMIPKKYFFVIAEHKDSFDSRYQEFGLVPYEYIEGKVIPIW
jgi:conjugal transfer pilin signal peptidase TrbI